MYSCGMICYDLQGCSTLQKSLVNLRASNLRASKEVVKVYIKKALASPLVLPQTQYCLQHLQQQNWVKEKKKQNT